MREDIINMLIYGNDSDLSTRYNFPIFVANMLSYSYKKLNSVYHRSMIVNRIESGYYSNEKEIENMARDYISNCILYSPDHGIGMLTSKCSLSEEEASEFIKEYIKYNENLKELLSAELDVSNTNIQMRDMVNKLISSFLNSEKNKTLQIN